MNAVVVMCDSARRVVKLAGYSKAFIVKLGLH